ncbi:MAG: MBL fold metallo-hydrolase [Eggerthellaceae bacterium]|nr:MBL fold metallo-hydrolase [Eggerthellaceae bacterium]
MRIHVLASGSGGNAAIVENQDRTQAILIDCGICKRDFFSRCKQVGFDPANIAAILITHAHSDHVKNLGVVTRGLAKMGVHPRVYAHEQLYNRHCKPLMEVFFEDNCTMYEYKNGEIKDIAGMNVKLFATSHDATPSCGFRFEEGDDALAFITDTGYVSRIAHKYLKDVRILALESNHDTDMLIHGPYPADLKARVASKRGHLSNEQAAEELESLLSPRLEHVIAMHISRNNNTYDLPRQVFEEVLARNNHGAKVWCAYQDEPISVG